jgi:hypothetical protein
VRVAILGHRAQPTRSSQPKKLSQPKNDFVLRSRRRLRWNALLATLDSFIKRSDACDLKQPINGHDLFARSNGYDSNLPEQGPPCSFVFSVELLPSPATVVFTGAPKLPRNGQVGSLSCSIFRKDHESVLSFLKRGLHKRKRTKKRTNTKMAKRYTAQIKSN